MLEEVGIEMMMMVVVEMVMKEMMVMVADRHGLCRLKLGMMMDKDEIWHHHILDTYKYYNDCLNIYGQFLHHYPYFGMRGGQDSTDLANTFKITQMLHLKEFGDYIYSFESEDI